jgi:hypothetical protein
MNPILVAGAALLVARMMGEKAKADALGAQKAAALADAGAVVSVPPEKPAAAPGGSTSVVIAEQKAAGAGGSAKATSTGTTIPAGFDVTEPPDFEDLPFVSLPHPGGKFLGKTGAELAAEGIVYGYATGNITGANGRTLKSDDYGYIAPAETAPGFQVYELPSGGKSSR